MAAASKQEPVRAKSKTREPARAIHARIEARFGESAVALEDAVDPVTLVRDAKQLIEVMTFLKTDPELAFDFLRSVTGIDWPSLGSIESVYHLYSYRANQAHVVKVRVPRARPEVPTVEGLWPTANWYEREAFDLVGIRYLEHSDLRRIMLPDDWVGHPLRKDYVEQADYHGIGTTRASPLDAFAELDRARRALREARGEAPPPVRTSPITPPEGWVDPKAKKAEADAAAKPKPAPKPAPKKEAPPKPSSPEASAPKPSAPEASAPEASAPEASAPEASTPKASDEKGEA